MQQPCGRSSKSGLRRRKFEITISRLQLSTYFFGSLGVLWDLYRKQVITACKPALLVAIAISPETANWEQVLRLFPNK